MKIKIISILLITCMFAMVGCKKAKDPANITINIESSCSYSVSYYLYYGAKNDTFYYVGNGNSEKFVKLYDGDRLVVKTTKNSGGTDSNPVKVTLLDGTTSLRSASSTKDGEEIVVDYTY